MINAQAGAALWPLGLHPPHRHNAEPSWTPLLTAADPSPTILQLWLFHFWRCVLAETLCHRAAGRKTWLADSFFFFVNFHAPHSFTLRGDKLLWRWLEFPLWIWSGIPLILWKMSADPQGCGNDTLLSSCCKSHAEHCLHVSAYSCLTSVILNRCHSLFRWGLSRSTGFNHHPLSVGSEHSFSGGSDFLQPPQEQRKSSKPHNSVCKWYEVCLLCDRLLSMTTTSV